MTPADLISALSAVERQDSDTIHPLNAREIRVLVALGSAPLDFRDVLAAARLPNKPTLTRAIDRLERDGLAERVDVPDDRRCVEVRRTRAGDALARRMLAGEGR